MPAEVRPCRVLFNGVPAPDGGNGVQSLSGATSTATLANNQVWEVTAVSQDQRVSVGPSPTADSTSTRVIVGTTRFFTGRAGDKIAAINA